MGKHDFISLYKTLQHLGTGEAKAVRMRTEREEICSIV